MSIVHKHISTLSQPYFAPQNQREWRVYKDVILDLYIGQKKRLKEVKVIMQENYYLKAT